MTKKKPQDWKLERTDDYLVWNLVHLQNVVGRVIFNSRATLYDLEALRAKLGVR